MSIRTLLMTGASLLIEDTQEQFAFEKTRSHSELLAAGQKKMSDIDPNFFSTPALPSEKWKGVDFPNRRLFTRFSAHGFHH